MEIDILLAGTQVPLTVSLTAVRVLPSADANVRRQFPELAPTPRSRFAIILALTPHDCQQTATRCGDDTPEMRGNIESPGRVGE